jgi:hypothetical protein
MKTLLILVSTAILTTACTTGRSGNMSTDDLNYYKVDCDIADQQKVFLTEQLRNTSQFDTNRRLALIWKINYIRDWCPTRQPTKPQGCVVAIEQMPSGASQATVCRSQKSGLAPYAPNIIDRWEAVVDK